MDVEVGLSERISTPLFGMLPSTHDCTRAVNAKAYQFCGVSATTLLSGAARRSVVVSLQPPLPHELPV
jgi:hypothetical protein